MRWWRRPDESRMSAEPLRQRFLDAPLKVGKSIGVALPEANAPAGAVAVAIARAKAPTRPPRRIREERERDTVLAPFRMVCPTRTWLKVGQRAVPREPVSTIYPKSD